MKQIAISGNARTALGKKATKEIRKNGYVPCVLYGELKDENGAPVAIHFNVIEKDINKLIYTPHIYLVDINIDGFGLLETQQRHNQRHAHIHPVGGLLKIGRPGIVVHIQRDLVHAGQGVKHRHVGRRQGQLMWIPLSSMGGRNGSAALVCGMPVTSVT